MAFDALALFLQSRLVRYRTNDQEGALSGSYDAAHLYPGV
jgi:hypothetical protein